MAYYRPATHGDAVALAPRMRQEDADEVLAADNVTPLEALQLGMAAGLSWAICTDDGEVVAIWGINPHPTLSRAGVVWLLGSDAIESREVRRQFIRQSRAMCDLLNEHCPLLTNHIDARNMLHIRWLQWCGFVFINTDPHYGHARLPFHEFIRIKPCALPQ